MQIWCSGWRFFSSAIFFLFSSMAENSAKVAKMARILAILHIIVGFLLILCGIADRVVGYFYTGYGYYGIWTGFLMSRVCVYSLTLIQSLIIFRKERLMFKLTKRWIFNLKWFNYWILCSAWLVQRWGKFRSPCRDSSKNRLRTDASRKYIVSYCMTCICRLSVVQEL